MRYRWIILAAGTAAQASASAFFQGLPSVAPALRDEYDLTLAQTGTALASVNLGMTVTLLAWGVLADRIGEHRVIPLGLVGTAAAAAIAPLAGGYAALLPCLFVGGLFCASVNAASGRAVIGWFGREVRGMALGVRQASLPIGAAVAAAALPAVAAAGGMDAVFVVLAGAMGAAALASALLLRAPARERDADIASDRPNPLRDARVWRVSIGSGCLAFTQFGFTGFVVLFLHDARGFSPAAAAAALVAIQGVGAVARVLIGRRSDREGARVAPLRRICLALAAACALLALVEPLPDAVVLPALGLAAFVSVSWNGLSLAAVAEAAQRGASGTAIGVQTTTLSVFATACLASFGAVVSATSWRFGFAALAVLPVLAFVLLGGGGWRAARAGLAGQAPAAER